MAGAMIERALDIQCSNCSYRFGVARNLLGKSVRCPNCMQESKVDVKPSALRVEKGDRVDRTLVAAH